MAFLVSLALEFIKKYWKIIGSTILILGSSWLIYHWIYTAGYDAGVTKITKEWDVEKAKHKKAIDDLKDDYAIREKDHREEVTRITHELSQAQLNHAVELANTAAEYDRRVRLSETRAAIYQRQAEGGADQCRDLAGHASRLDASLEEGRSLVRELRETLGFRDQQLKAVSQQLLADRALYED